MKLRNQSRAQGGALVITLVTGLAIGVVLASFLALISSRNKLTMRSMGWNATIPVLEAGIEEALTHLNRNPGKPNNDGWTATTVGGQPVHTKKRTFTDGSAYYVAIYNATANNPVIYSSGFSPSPLENNKYISRLVEVTTTNPPAGFTKAIAANGTISFTGGSGVDSFDSRRGGYNTLTNRNANGALATNAKIPGAISVGNGKVYGPAVTGPGGTVTTGPNGAVGDVAWIASQNGIKPGWTNNNMNVSYPPNSPPSGGPFLAPTVVAGVMYLGTVTNQLSSFSGSGNTTPIVVNGHATLYVTGDFSLSGQSKVLINPGASLTLIIGGKATLSGGGVVNTTGLAANFSLIGLPTCTDITYSGHSSFIGTVNAPQASLTITGTAAAFGAAIVNSSSFSGGAYFHYDEALAKSSGLVVTGWKEL